MKINQFNVFALRKTFVRQLNENDCGQACIAMLLLYTGDFINTKILLNQENSGNLSLLSMKKTLQSFNYEAQCVTMTISFLKTHNSPVILHTTTDDGLHHYQICYGYISTWEGKRFLMADPANHFHYIDAEQLDKIWQSKAAIFIDDIQANPNKAKNSSIFNLIKIIKLPLIVWVLMPALTLINALFGISVSFLLQRGLFDQELFNSKRIIISSIILLFVISLFRSGFNYIRQLVLLNLNSTVRRFCFHRLSLKIFLLRAKHHAPDYDWIKKSFQDISLVQNSFSIFVTSLISEGSLILFLLAAIFYLSFYAGITISLYLISFMLYNLFVSPQILFNNYEIRKKYRLVEKTLNTAAHYSQISITDLVTHEIDHLNIAADQAIKLNKKGAVLEILSMLVVLFILGIVSYQNYHSEIPYSTLMFTVVGSYFITTISVKLRSSYFLFNEGADIFNQFYIRTSH
jgi:ATP-binding cassette, subfamily C, bacteriocin exporter